MLSHKEADEIERKFVADWMQVDQASIEETENFVRMAEMKVLSPNHHFVMKVKSHLVMLYSLKQDTKCRAILEKRLKLCTEVVKWVSYKGGKNIIFLKLLFSFQVSIQNRPRQD